MAFTIQLMRLPQSPNVINKTPSVAQTLSGDIKEPCSLTDPEITLHGQFDTTVSYFYIPLFMRYYFLTDVTILSGDKYKIKGHVDVLYTYKDAIIASEGMVTKSEHNLGLGLSNDGVNTPAYDVFDRYGYTINGPDFVPDGGMYILTVAGG